MGWQGIGYSAAKTGQARPGSKIHAAEIGVRKNLDDKNENDKNENDKT